MNIENGFWLEFPEGSLDIVDDVKDDLIVTLSSPEDGLWVKFPEGSIIAGDASIDDNNSFRNQILGNSF